MKKIFFLILISTCLLISNSNAQEKCLSGKAGNNHLIDQLKNAQISSPISKLISDKYNLSQKTEADANCADCEKKNKTQDLNKITKEKTYFKSECIEAAASIQTGSREISCPDQKIAKHQFCFTKTLVSYQNAVLSEMYKCIKFTTAVPITPNDLFEMYTLESAFKPAYTNGGGTGLGQLTGIFIKDLHLKGRGLPILNSIANSTNKSCDAAKLILNTDLKTQPQFKNKCEFTQYGEGLERNMLYTLAGLANAWQKDIEPLLKEFNLKNNENPMLQKAQAKALLNSYGPGGRAAARAAVRRLSKLNPEEFISAMTKPLRAKNNNNLTTYTTRMHKKQNIIGQKLSGELKSRFNKEGSAACTE